MAYLEDHQERVIGMDVEYTASQKRGQFPVEQQKAALIQLCCGTRCLLYQVSLATEVSRELKCFLRDSKYCFVGFSIGRDKDMLKRWDIEVTNYFDIQADWVVPRSTKLLDSLADVAGRLVDPSFLKLKDNFNKDHHARWAEPLCEEQIVYACKDAYACYAIWNRVDFILQGLYAAQNRRMEKSLKNKWEAERETRYCW